MFSHLSSAGLRKSLQMDLQIAHSLLTNSHSLSASSGRCEKAVVVNDSYTESGGSMTLRRLRPRHFGYARGFNSSTDKTPRCNSASWWSTRIVKFRKSE